MQTNIQTVLLRTSFRVSFLLLGAIIIIANVAIYIHEQRGELKAEFIRASHYIIKLLKENLALTGFSWCFTSLVLTHSQITPSHCLV